MKHLRLAILFAVLSAVLWGVAFWQRGHSDMEGFHSIYEPWLLNLLVIVNLPAGLLASILTALLGSIGITIDGQSLAFMWIWIAASSLQWGLIGYAVDVLLRRIYKPIS